MCYPIYAIRGRLQKVRVITMKIVEGSLHLQDMEIRKTVEKFYNELFPMYFTKEQIDLFALNEVLSVPGSDSHIGTLEGAFQAMSYMQTLMIILENQSDNPKAVELFNRNSQLLNELGIFFPFEHKHFFGEDRQIELPLYQTKAANTYLI